jgi:nucleoside-diphosphate-sugar epimerase
VNKKILFLGQGYVANYVAKILPDNFEFIGTNRNNLQIKDISLDITHILVSIPPDDNGDIFLHQYAYLLDKMYNIEWIGYLSTTGVYGDHLGNIVDETSELKATESRSKNRILAEKQWLNTGLFINIFRLSGIYGCGRSAIDDLLNNCARIIEKPNHVFSRIYVEDIAQIIIAAINKPIKNAIYNLADDMPSAQGDVVKYACSKLNLALPPIFSYDDPSLSPMLRSFYMSSRRISNQKIKDILNVKLFYANYQNGIDKIIKEYQNDKDKNIRH